MARRARSPFLALLVLLAVALAGPARAAAQDDARALVKASVVTEIPGFQLEDQAAAGTGYLELADLVTIADAAFGDRGAEFFEDEFDAGRVAAYNELFSASDGTFVTISAFALGPLSADRDEFERGFFSGLGGESTEIDSPVEPDLVTVHRTELEEAGASFPAIAALYFADDVVISVLTIGEAAEQHSTDAITAQVTHRPPASVLPSIPRPETDDEDEGGLAYALGSLFGLALVVSGIVLVVVWLVRKVRGDRGRTVPPMPPMPGAVGAAPPPPPYAPPVVADAEVASPDPVATASHGAGSLTITTTKTVPAPADRVYRAIADEDERSSWVPDDDLLQVVATEGRWVRFAWGPNDARVAMRVSVKDDGRSTVTIRHTQLRSSAEADLAKAHWKSCLSELAAHLAAARV